MAELISQIHTATTSLPNNEPDRIALLHATRALLQKLETPEERVLRMCYHNTAIFSYTKILIDLGLFKILSNANTPLTSSALADSVNSDPILITRLLKQISVESLIEETGPDTYIANNVTRCIASPGAEGTIADSFQLLKIWDAFPDYLKETQYKNPDNKDTTVWKYAYDTPLQYFEYINQSGHEKQHHAFQQHMKFKTVGLKWFEVPELTTAVFSDFQTTKHHQGKEEKDNVLLVDVGGNSGHDLLQFQAAQPTLPGRLILQDLPTQIQSLSPENLASLPKANITPMSHDFFTPQPIHGARVYYSKMCLHDWPNAQCVQILRQLRGAMKIGYSKILLNEIVVKEEGAGWFETSVDGLMMVVHGAQERREKEWRALVEQVGGLRVVKIWDVEGAVEKVIGIEAV